MSNTNLNTDIFNTNFSGQSLSQMNLPASSIGFQSSARIGGAPTSNFQPAKAPSLYDQMFGANTSWLDATTQGLAALSSIGQLLEGIDTFGLRGDAMRTNMRIANDANDRENRLYNMQIDQFNENKENWLATNRMAREASEKRRAPPPDLTGRPGRGVPRC